MKLRDAVLLGRSCGLATVEECITNVDIHSMSLFTYIDIEDELRELYADYARYKTGDLTLGWSEIANIVNHQYEEMKASSYGDLDEDPVEVEWEPLSIA